MNETIITAKISITAFFAAMATFLGWKGLMALALAVLMTLDYISGWLAARKNGTWKSAIAREGIAHKAGMVLVVVVALVADVIMALALTHIPVVNIAWPECLFPIVLAWYIITELGSILENAVKLGAKVPAWFVKIFDATLKMVDHVADEVTDLEKAAGVYEQNALVASPENDAPPDIE